MNKCDVCRVAVEAGVNGQVFSPLGIVSVYCNDCLGKYDTVRRNCADCMAPFDPQTEGVVGDAGRQYCGSCCNGELELERCPICADETCGGWCL